MATFHTSLRVLCRSKGESSVAAAAYRAGASLHDARIGLTQDYSRRHGVVEVDLLAPLDAPDWARDLRALWNAVEARETRINARLARELIVGLPHEVEPPKRARLARDIAQLLVDRYGVAVQLAIHAPDAAGDARNHHVHLLFTTRSIAAKGWGPKTRVLDEPKTGPSEVTWIREQVAKLINEALATAGSTERVDHRTLHAQAKDAEAKGDFQRAARLTRLPTRHQGRSATARARRGERVDVVLDNQAKMRLHREAYTRYLRHVRAQARLVSPASRRALLALGTQTVPSPASSPRPRPRMVPSAPGAAVLDAQARQADLAHGGGSKASRAYLEGLRRTVEEGQRWLDAYVAVVGRQHALTEQLAKSDDKEAVEALRQSVQVNRELRRIKRWNRQQFDRWQRATSHRLSEQQLADVHEQSRPKRWRLDQQAAWRRERQAQWGRLRRAMAAETAARDSSIGAKEVARAETLRLRGELRAFEAAIAHAVQRASQPFSQPQSYPANACSPPPPNAPARRPSGGLA